MSVRLIKGSTTMNLEPEDFKEEDKVVLPAVNLTSVVDLQVINETRRRDVCSIFGKISASAGPLGGEFNGMVTIFDRPPDSPEEIVIADPFFQYLTLTDNPKAPPRILYDSSEFHIQMQLFEREEEEDEDDYKAKKKDTLIADTGKLSFEHGTLYNARCSQTLEGKEGFKFNVSYIGVQGCPVRVSVEFSKHISDSSSITFHGLIASHIRLDYGDSTVTRLFFRYHEEPITVCGTNSIPLDRSVMVAPAGRKCFMSIIFNLVVLSEKNEVLKVVQDDVPFIFPKAEVCSFYYVTNRRRSHTKKAAGGLISITLDVLEEGPDMKEILDKIL